MIFTSTAPSLCLSKLGMVTGGLVGAFQPSNTGEVEGIKKQAQGSRTPDLAGLTHR